MPAQTGGASTEPSHEGHRTCRIPGAIVSKQRPSRPPTRWGRQRYRDIVTTMCIVALVGIGLLYRAVMHGRLLVGGGEPEEHDQRPVQGYELPVA
jgi:hypothetical protein